ncbi:hypothetical protein P5673_028034 [Acropora cervicornis]|uniref:Uncharacterized protein n=1 Tax=Acropora cervicornis TaxID=6130 RepID=A0AAD9PXX1_ACRCE|nr:hypothetical protein P5673_028034 [Acropora cervicornis]
MSGAKAVRIRKQFQLKQDSFTTLSEMKSTAFLVAFCFLILETQGATKVAPDHFFKMSAAQRWQERRMPKNDVCDETKRNLARVII